VSTLKEKIYRLGRAIIDLFVDTTYFGMWVAVNWLLHRAFRRFHPSDLVFAVFVISRAIFAFATLAVIGLHAWNDIISEAEGGYDEVTKKIRDMGKGIADMIIFATYLVVWVVLNYFLDHIFEYLEDQSIITAFMHGISQFVIAAVSLHLIVKEILTELGFIYRDLFE
jgi:hypothetical protein